MKLTRRKFLKWLATVLAAWGIAPAALAQLPAAPVKNLYFRHDGSSYEAYEPEPLLIGTRITGYRKVIFNSKDYGVVSHNNYAGAKWSQDFQRELNRRRSLVLNRIK